MLDCIGILLERFDQIRLWAKIDQDEELGGIEIDEDEFQELFQAELTTVDTNKARLVHTKK